MKKLIRLVEAKVEKKEYSAKEAAAVALKVKQVLEKTLAANGDEVHNTAQGTPDITIS